jgi:hypothetical protein
VVREQIKILVPRLAKAKIQTSGKLLGVFIGPGADEQQWCGVAEELRTRSRYLASLNIAWSGVAPLYRSHVASVTSHILQFAAPSRELLQVESNCLAVVTKTPSRAVPLAVLSRLKEFGLATNFVSIGILGEASAYHAMACSGVYPLMMAELARARRSRYSNLSPFLRWWTRGGVLGYLAKIKEHVEFVACTLPIENYGIQRWAAKFLHDSIPIGTVDACLVKRLSTLLKEEVSEAAAVTVRARILAAKGAVPQCAVASMLRTVCNAWTTTGRFSGPTGLYPFGCVAAEADRFMHFPCFSSLREMWGDVCPGALVFINALSANIVTLTSPVMSGAEVVQAIIWTDVVGQCLNDAKADNPPRLIVGTVGKNMLIARLRFLGVQSDSTRHTIQGMRSLFIVA